MSMAEPTPIDLARTAAAAADDKKGDRTLVFAVGDVLAITDYFVITSASNRRLVRTLVESVEDAVRDAHGRSPRRVEGLAELQWVLMDYGEIVVHVFNDDMRAYYEIERLYRDVPSFDWRADIA